MNAEDRTDEFPTGEPENEDLPTQFGTGIVGKAAISGAATALSAAIPAAAIPIAVISTALQELGTKLNKLEEDRTKELLWHAANKSKLSPAEVVEELLKDDNIVLLATEALDAARRTRLKEKVKALGDSLGALLEDDALIDPESIWIRILASIEPPHVRLLHLFLQASILRNGLPFWKPLGPVNVRDAAKKLGLEDAVLPLVQDLIRNGLIMTPGISAESSESGMIPTEEFAADGLNSKFVATWLGAELFTRLGKMAE